MSDEEAPVPKGTKEPQKKKHKSVDKINWSHSMVEVEDPTNPNQTVLMKHIHAFLCPINGCFDSFSTSQGVKRHCIGVLKNNKQFVPGTVSLFKIFLIF